MEDLEVQRKGKDCEVKMKGSSKESLKVEIKDKLNLTIEEAAVYSNISSKTLRRIINEYTPDFLKKYGEILSYLCKNY